MPNRYKIILSKTEDLERRIMTLKPAEVSLVINAQYIKDLSFENPKGYKAFLPNGESPNIDVNIQVKSEVVDQNVYEVIIEQKCHAKVSGETLFLIEITYAGLFSIEAPKENLGPILFVECPRLLFPFVRSIIADVTKDSGFPPLVLSPVNFAGLYLEQIQQPAEENAKTEKKSKK